MKVSMSFSALVAAATMAGIATAQTAAQTATEFCADYTAKCADQPNMFADTAACETFYTDLAAGTLADPISDTAPGVTRACSQYHLGLATDNETEAIHCPHARGTRVCVAQVPPQTASEFCTDYTAKCADQPNPFADTAACETFYTVATAGTLADPISDTVSDATRACFQYHLTLATGSAMEAIHCPHARGTSVCVAASDGSGAAKVAGGFVALFAVLLALAF